MNQVIGKNNLLFLLIIIMKAFQILMALMQSQTSGSNFGIVQNLETTCVILFLWHWKGLTH